MTNIKELSIEQKAKRYDEVIEIAKKWRNAPNVNKIPTFANRVIEEIFPELAESEDERIRKEIISALKFANVKGVYDKHIAWLEKQGEQILANSAKTGKIKQKLSWSEEDKNIMYDTLSNLTELKDRYGEGYGNVGKCIGWLKTLKERYTWKPSDEQMKALRDLNLTGNISYAGQGQTLIELYNDLKKLKG